jgi:branched-chain amino acid transport system substrate-binding protein
MTETDISRIAIYHSNDEYGHDFSFVLEDEMTKRGIVVIDRLSSITPASIDAIMDRWRAFGCDGVVMASASPRIIEPAQLIHTADSSLPIFGADNLQSLAFIDAMRDSIGAVYMALYSENELTLDFIENFRSVYGYDPGINAMSGYTAVKLLADAMNVVGSTDSAAIAGFLSTLKDYESIVGTLSYNPETREFDGFNLTVRSFESYLQFMRLDMR